MTLEIQSWITGFTDGEGCFCVSFSKREKLKTGIEVRPSFSLSQSSVSKDSLELIKKTFGVGGIRFSKTNNCYKYEVRSFDDLQNVVIPHFQKYPLQTAKEHDFLVFVKVIDVMKRKHHLSCNGMRKIVNLVFDRKTSLVEKRARIYDKETLLKLLRS